MQSERITPDTKDWTWVLKRPCPECGFDAAAGDPLAVGDVTRTLVPRWVDVLARDDVRERPAPDVWSPLEYAAHVRDVLRVFDGRLRLMIEENDPRFADWDQDAAAVADSYGTQDPTIVAAELAAAGDAVADRFDAVGADQLDRSGLRSNGSEFTVRTLGQYFLHDIVHHLHDVDA